MSKINPKKSLGQNFLNNDHTIERIIDSADVDHHDVILEIGAGKGVLTSALAQSAQKVIAIEVDERLITFLQKKFINVENIEIIHADILKIDIDEFLYKKNIHKNPYKVIANIPYYITAPIIRLLLELELQPKTIVLMVQKEVAIRLCAKPGSMSVLAIAAQYYADVKYLFDVPKEDFVPTPSVDSAVIKLIPKKQKSKEDENFFHVVKIGFSARRKTLINNLVNGLHCDKNNIENIFEQIGFGKNVRAQELSIAQWKDLIQMIENEKLLYEK